MRLKVKAVVSAKSKGIGKSFDWREIDEAEDWVAKQLKKGNLVYAEDNQNDTYSFIAGPTKEDCEAYYANYVDEESRYPLRAVTSVEQVHSL